MGIFTDSQLVSAIMLYEDIDFKTLSDKKLHAIVHHTYKRSQNKFIFKKYSATNDPNYGKSTVVFSP